MSFHSPLTFLPLALLLLQDGAPAPAPIELPEDPAAIVLALDHRGGFGPPRETEEPWIQVRADGLVRVPRRMGAPREFTLALEARELQDLVRFVVVEQDLLAFDAAAVEREIARLSGEPHPTIVDAGETVISVAVRGRARTLRFEAAFVWAAEYPSISALQRFEAVRLRLEHLRYLTQAGGPARASELLAHANRALAVRDPARAPLALEHLWGVAFPSAESTELSFRRREERGGETFARVEVVGAGEPAVTLELTEPSPADR